MDRNENLRHRRFVESIKTTGPEKFPHLVGKSISGFEVVFHDGYKIKHSGGLSTLPSTLIDQHGGIKKVVAF
jgi:hypothetical protein